MYSESTADTLDVEFESKRGVHVDYKITGWNRAGSNIHGTMDPTSMETGQQGEKQVCTGQGQEFDVEHAERETPARRPWAAVT